MDTSEIEVEKEKLAKEKNEETYDKTPSSMEDLLVAAGTKGWWNVLIFLGCAWGSFVSPMHILSYQFLGATPDYWCHIPELVEANWTQRQIRSFSTPEGSSSSCEMFDFNYTIAAEIGFTESVRQFENHSRTSVTCDIREFDSNEPITVVSKWDLVCDRRALYSTTQAAVQAGKLIGSLTMGYLTDLLGRRRVYIWCSPVYLFIGLMTAFSPNVAVYIILKFLISTVTSAFYISGLVLSMELCSVSQRSFIGALFAIPWALGYMVLPGIAYYIRPFTYLQIATTLPVLTIIPNVWIIPESPRWLVLKGRFEDAVAELRRIAHHNKANLPSKAEIISIMKQIHSESVTQSSRKSSVLKNIFHKLFRLWTMKEWRLILPILFFSWFSASLVYYGVSLNPPDLKAGKYLYVFLGGLLEIPAYLLLWPANIFIGRKRCLILLYSLCAIAIFGGMGVSLLTGNGKSLELWPGAYQGLLTLSLIGKFAITAAFQLLWMYSTELLPTEFRSIVVGEASVFGNVGSICSPYIVDLLSEVSDWAPGAIFGSVTVLALFFLSFLPETMNVVLAEFAQTTVDVEDENDEENMSKLT